MAFDGVFLHQIVKQLQVLKGGKISKIYQISDTEILFVIKNYHMYNLMISAHSSYNRIHLTNKSYPTRSLPSNFIMLLRKYLEGGVINAITQKDLDRYLCIEISSRNDIGDKINLQLYVELMGKYANIILVNQNKIIDALKHIPPFENTIRTIQPSAVFKPTAPQKDKVNPFEITSITNDENLFTSLMGFSPLLSEEVRYRLTKQSYQEIMAEIQQSNSIFICEKGEEEFFHCIPLTHISNNHKELEICAGLDHIYYHKEEKERIRHITGDLFKFIRKEIKKISNKIDRLNQQKDEALDCDKYRYWGDIIFANLDQIKKGQSKALLKDFDDNDVVIELDNKLDGKGNGKKYFTKYHKLSVGLKYIDEQLEIAKDNLAYFQQLESQLQMADFASAKEIKTELQNLGFLSVKNNKDKIKKSLEPNYKTFKLNDKIIYVGTNNIQNDYITFKKANRFDYWFHVKDASGCHLVINSDTLNEQEIRLCAMLAAYYSKLAKSSSVAVNYTLIKNLKKIPGNKLGKVIIKEYKTIYIDVDEKQLLETFAIE